MTIGQVRQAAADGFRTISDSPDLDAEVLLAFILATDRTWVLAHEHDLFPERLRTAWNDLINRRLTGTPIAYLTGQQAFHGHTFLVTPDVLIPRPATELIIAAVEQSLPPEFTGTIVDIGTGSGAIILSLLKHFPAAHGIASDISEPALTIATQNAQRLGMIDRIEFRSGPLLLPYTEHHLEVIIANLPYLSEAQMGEPSIQSEPSSALRGGTDGFDLIRQLIEQLQHRVDWDHVVLEFDPSQHDVLAALLAETWTNVVIDWITDGHSIRGVHVSHQA